MAEIPRAVLSEHFQERLRGRRLVSAVFLTFRFDPEFFEQEVLPVFLDLPLSHAKGIKLVQLEDALRVVPGSIAVYYDENGLVAEAGSAKLDVKRIAVRHRTGIFHPKNAFVLVEDTKPDDNGSHARALLVASLSANLTQSGWWENVEVCHVEEIRDGDFTRVGGDVLRFLDGLDRRLADKAADGHAALRDIRGFLRGTEQRAQRSADGRLHTHFFAGLSSFSDFLEEAAGSSIHGMNLEVISPYFDGTDHSTPLAELIDRFEPRAVQVYLPRNDSGEALCDGALYEWVRSQTDVTWSHFPKELLRRGKNDDARRRFVHAKVYRFFSAQPKKEILFIGSVNLTCAAHQNGGNLETGFLVEIEPTRKPEWWTSPDERRPIAFKRQLEDEGVAASGGTRLSLRYWWDKETAEAFWDDADQSPPLSIESQGVLVFTIDKMPGRVWTPLPSEACRELQRVLRSTSIFTVMCDGTPGLLLVQEEGMSHRPSLLFDLTPAEILRYWALLTPEQRSAFLEARAPQVAFAGEGAALLSRHDPLVDSDSLFDRFAGIFHAFGCAERSARLALREGREREATHRLFGRKYDSLGCLLARIEKSASAGTGDLLENYVIVLCAKQLVQELKREFREYWDAHVEDDRRLREQFELIARLRGTIIERDPDRMSTFLDWFENWFLKKAAPVALEEVE